MVVSLGVDSEGALVNQQQCWTVPGLPAWFALRRPVDGDQGCLFVTYPNTNSIGIFQLESGGVNSGTTAKMVSSVATKGVNPVYADVTVDGSILVVADYHGPDDATSSEGAGVESFAISADCALTFADFREHSGGSGKVPDRQGAAHPHSAVAWGHDLVFVCDLGADKIFSYRVGANGSLSVLSSVDTSAGFGPRHSVPHPTQEMLFVVGEMGSEVLTYHIDETTGTLTLASSVSTKPNTDPGSYGSKAAEVVISPDGLHLYASNRAFSPGFRNTVAVFRLMDGGVLDPLQHMDCPAFPRGMTMTPDGKALLVASQTDGQVVSYKVDPENGLLSEGVSRQEGPVGAAAFAILPELPARATRDASTWALG
jgi:6-phosphogluconolactonase